jgi:hypothetical protein
VCRTRTLRSAISPTLPIHTEIEKMLKSVKQKWYSFNQPISISN